MFRGTSMNDVLTDGGDILEGMASGAIEIDDETLGDPTRLLEWLESEAGKGEGFATEARDPRTDAGLRRAPGGERGGFSMHRDPTDFRVQLSVARKGATEAPTAIPADRMADGLLSQAFGSLGRGEWTMARAQACLLLGKEPDNAEAILAKLMAELHVRRRDGLACYVPETGRPLKPADANALRDNPLFARAVACAVSEDRRRELEGYARSSSRAVTELIYARGKALSGSSRLGDLREAVEILAGLDGFADSRELARACDKMAEEATAAASLICGLLVGEIQHAAVAPVEERGEPDACGGRDDAPERLRALREKRASLSYFSLFRKMDLNRQIAELEELCSQRHLDAADNVDSETHVQPDDLDTPGDVAFQVAGFLQSIDGKARSIAGGLVVERLKGESVAFGRRGGERVMWSVPACDGRACLLVHDGALSDDLPDNLGPWLNSEFLREFGPGERHRIIGPVFCLRETEIDDIFADTGAENGFYPALWLRLSDPSDERGETAASSVSVCDATMDPLSRLISEYGLSKREAQVASILASGGSASSVCVSLGIAIGTVRIHMSHLYKKLGVHSKGELIELLHSGLGGRGEDVRVSMSEDCAALRLTFGLTSREIEVVRLLNRGYPLDRISEELSISMSTVRFHVKNVYDKLGIHSRQELATIGEQIERSRFPESGPRYRDGGAVDDMPRT